DSLRKWRASLRAKGVEAPAALYTTLDAARFKQLLYNYLSNAVKFTPEHGHVAMRITHEGERSFRLEVEDTGIGIGPRRSTAVPGIRSASQYSQSRERHRTRTCAHAPHRGGAGRLGRCARHARRGQRLLHRIAFGKHCSTRQ